MENPGCYRLFREGDVWIATGPTFVSRTTSPLGRGTTYQDAINDLISKPAFEEWLRSSGVPRDDCIAEAMTGEVGTVIHLPDRSRHAG